jgi:signal-transduction protein with cAMP-binding, CBS, and nucleotidyltransferase domain
MATIPELVARMIEDPGTQEIYVNDTEGHYLGLITAQRLAHVVFSHRLPVSGSPIELLDLLSSETADHMLVRESISIHEDEPLTHAIDLMFRAGLIEIPVLDDDRTIVGNINLLDILAAWKEGRLIDHHPSPDPDQTPPRR